jgi:outer membrane protein assembly factor BamB
MFSFSGGMKCVLAALATTASLFAASPEWPQFRGPGARGVAENPRLPERWSATENVEWRTDVPGRGWSCPIVAGNRVFLTTVASEGVMEDPKKGLYFGGERRDIPKTAHQWLVLCYDLQTGREIWRRQAHTGAPENPLHVKNTYASETPVTDGERVYAYFGNVGLFCHDLEGKLLWKTSWPPVKTRYGWGSAASPVLHKDRLFVVNDNEDGSYITALEAKTGRQLWRRDRDEKSNWATPFMWQNDKLTEVVTAGTKKVRSYDLDGNLLWELGGMSTIVIPTPFEAGGLLYVCSGYVGDKHRPVYAIKPGARGDISLPEGETSSEFIAWYQPTAAPYNPSPLVYKGNFYVLFDFGFLGCYDAKSGRQFYEKERIRPEGQTAFTASPWGYKDRVFALSEDGDTYVFEAGPQFKLLHKNSLDEMCMASPAIAGDRLLIRSLTRLYCLRQKQE